MPCRRLSPRKIEPLGIDRVRPENARFPGFTRNLGGDLHPLMTLQQAEEVAHAPRLVGGAGRAGRGGPVAVDEVGPRVARALEPASRVIYLQADICRQDLLVEIEATGMCPLKADA